MCAGVCWCAQLFGYLNQPKPRVCIFSRASIWYHCIFLDMHDYGVQPAGGMMFNVSRINKC